jgi:hypothetical protein
MSEKTIELCAPLLMPEILDSCDDCLEIMVENLSGRKGISRVHAKNDQDHPHLCFHYDPNQISAATVQDLAEQGASTSPPVTATSRSHSAAWMLPMRRQPSPVSWKSCPACCMPM